MEIVLLDSDAETIFNRRRYDLDKQRILNIEQIETELILSRLYFMEYCKDLRISGVSIYNNDIYHTTELLMRCLE